MEERKEEGSKYIRSGFNKQQLSDIGQMIQQYIETQKPYLNPEYNLELMAKDLNITRQNLSQAINDEIGKNFYQLINEFRVTEFKKYLNDPENESYHLSGTGLRSRVQFQIIVLPRIQRNYRRNTYRIPTENKEGKLKKLRRSLLCITPGKRSTTGG